MFKKSIILFLGLFCLAFTLNAGLTLPIDTPKGKIVFGSKQRPLRVVANLSRANYAADTTSSGNEMRQDRVPNYIAQDTNEIWLVYANWWLDIGAGGREVATGNSVILGAALEYNGITVVAPNASAYTLADNETFLAGPFKPSSFNVGKFSAGTQMFSRTVITVTAGQNIPRSGQYLSEAPASRLNSAVGVNQLSGTGVYVGANNQVGPSPIMVIGRTLAPSTAIIEIGDSIGEGQNDANQYPSVNVGGGFVQRGAWNANKTAIAQLGRHGGQLSRLFNGSDGAKRRALYKYATSTIIVFGANDLFDPNTSTTFLNNLASEIATMRAAGVKYVVVSSVGPRTNSTDSWATLVNQTTQASWDTAKSATVNNAEAALTSGNSIYFDGNIYWGDSGAASKWIVTGAANYATTDGTHPNQVVMTTAGAGMTTLINAMPKY